jgi:hypothetical protein
MQKIELDEGVPVTPPRKCRSFNDPRAKQLLEMDINVGHNSFFLVGKTKKDVRSLVALGKRIGAHLIAREFPVGTDAVYDEAGVRVWRVSEDKVPRRKAHEDEDL